jgi:hypothetical protein
MNDDASAPALAPVTHREFTDIEIARMLGRVITLAARQLNLPFSADVRLDDQCRAILMAARGGKLSPDAYRLLWWYSMDRKESRASNRD